MNEFRFAITYEGLEAERPAFVTWFAPSSQMAAEFIQQDLNPATIRLVTINGTRVDEMMTV